MSYLNAWCRLGELAVKMAGCSCSSPQIPHYQPGLLSSIQCLECGKIAGAGHVVEALTNMCEGGERGEIADLFDATDIGTELGYTINRVAPSRRLLECLASICPQTGAGKLKVIDILTQYGIWRPIIAADWLGKMVPPEKDLAVGYLARCKDDQLVYALLEKTRRRCVPWAIATLQLMATPKAIKALRAACSFSDPRTRCEAVRAIGNMNLERLVPFLRELLEVETDYSVMEAIEDALGRITV